jgi:hypothetical protein
LKNGLKNALVDKPGDRVTGITSALPVIQESGRQLRTQRQNVTFHKPVFENQFWQAESSLREALAIRRTGFTAGSPAVIFAEVRLGEALSLEVVGYVRIAQEAA